MAVNEVIRLILGAQLQRSCFHYFPHALQVGFQRCFPLASFLNAPTGRRWKI